jgi:hypothetical protein
MRQIFSIRFFAAVGALVGLTALLLAVFRSDDSVAEQLEPDLVQRRIELVSLVFEARQTDFSIAADGTTRGTLDLVLDGERTVHVVEGTPGEVACDRLDGLARCAVLADLLGNGVVWFRVVPLRSSDEIELPAIVSLDSGIATLTDGLQLPFAPILERTCERDFDSFREFRAELETAFTSIYSLEEQRIVEVVCDPAALD